MIEYIYIPIILILYYKVKTYNWKIDDHVEHDGVGYQITTGKVDPKLYDNSYSWREFLKSIIVMLATCGYIHYLFGWKAAVIYAVHPLLVNGVAWKTGNYYTSTTLLVLASFMCLRNASTMPFIWPEMAQISTFAILSGCFFSAALNSQPTALPFIFIALFHPYGWPLIVPLATFLLGKRMHASISQRKTLHENLNIKSLRLSLLDFANVPKVIAYYICLSSGLTRLGFFHSWGKGQEYFRPRTLILSITLCLLFIVWGWQISPLAVIWFFLFIGLFSQFYYLSQFIAERYMILPMVGVSILFSEVITNNYIFTVYCTILLMRSLDYLKAWKNNENLFSHSASSFPEAAENWNNLGNIHLDRGHVSLAIRPLLMAEKLSQGNKYNIYANLAKCYAGTLQWQTAHCYIVEALKESPRNQKESLLKIKEDLEYKIKKLSRQSKELKRMGIL